MIRKLPRFTPRMLSVPAAILSGMVLQSLPLQASAQPTPGVPQLAETRSYAIPAGPLAEVLSALASASGSSIAYEPAALQSLASPGASGSMTVAAALEQALSGTGLNARRIDAGRFAVGPAVVEVVARRDEAETSFKADYSRTSTRGDGYLQDVPGSITLLTSKLMETQQVVNLNDALRNVSGVSLTQSSQSTPRYSIRGMMASASTNGVADSGASNMNVFGVERVEVLKGPQAILSGADSLGGAVNIVLKKPQAEPIRDLTLQFGSHADKTIAADLSGALSADRKLTYRLVGAAADARSAPGGYDGRENQALTPSLRWKDDDTDLVVGTSYTDQHAAVPLYTFATRDGAILPPPAMLLGHPSDGFDTTDKRLNYEFEHKFGPSLTLVSRWQRTLQDLDIHVATPEELFYDEETGAMTGAGSLWASRVTKAEATSSGDHYLRAAFSTGPLEHRVSVGINETRLKYVQSDYGGDSTVVQLYPARPQALAPLRDRTPELFAVTSAQTRQRGVYIQEVMSYDKWNLLLNARRTRYTSGAQSLTPADGNLYTSPAETTARNTPGAGVVYKLSPATSLYASYSEGFVPQPGLSCSLEALPPVVSKNQEAGAKMQFMDDRFALTTSVFSLEVSNQLLYQELGGCYEVRPGQRTRGIEIDAQGSPLRGLDLVFNYTYNSITDVGDPTTLFVGQPRHKMSFWSTYAFQTEKLKGYSVGFGVNANSSSLGSYDPLYPVTVPGQAQIDANIAYGDDKLSVILGVKNLAGRRIYGTATSNTFIPVLSGREFMLTVKRSFD